MNRAKSTRRVRLLGEDRVADVSTPHRQALALALLQVAAANDGPACVAGEHPPGRLDLIVEIDQASKTCEPPPRFTIALSFHEYTSRSSRGGHHRTRTPGGRPAAPNLRTACAVPVEYRWMPHGTSTMSTPSQPATARLMTSGRSWPRERS